MSDSGPSGVQVRNLGKRYGAVEAVRDASFAAGPGEILGLLGRNGAGKTTTLECMLGLRRPDRGSVTIAGIDAIAEPERAKAIVGAQLQAATLQNKMTPRQALRFFASFYRQAASIDRLLERFALTPKADAAFDSLSGGQKQRLFLALAFVHQPRVVVLDEPTAGLDPQARHELHGLISEARAAGVCVVLSTHDLDEAEHLCDRVGILHEGTLIALGTPAELLSGARAKPRIVVRTARPLDQAALTGLPGIAGVLAPTSTPAALGSTTTVECADVNAAIMAIAQHLTRSGVALLNVQIQQPTLEQVFIERTGSAWAEEPAA